MRELKFRAWDKLTKTYYAVSGLEFDENGELCEVWLADILVTESNDACRDPKDVVLEQYTVLKDKDGKEIYEGDIVGFKWTKRLYVVTYRRYDASFILENDEWEETIHLSMDKDDFEVFGNVHMNPELLEEENERER